MVRSAIKPRVQAFVLCQGIAWSPDGAIAIVNPTSGVTVTGPLAPIPLGVYAHVTDSHGHYEVGLEIRDSMGVMLWSEVVDTFEELDPLEPHRILVPSILLPIAEPGVYDVVLTLNGEPLAEHVLHVRHG